MNQHELFFNTNVEDSNNCQTFNLDKVLEHSLNVSPILNNVTQCKDKPNNSQNIMSVPFTNDIEHFKHILKTDTLLLAAKWYSNKVIPRKEVQILFSDVQYFNNSFLHILKNKVINSLSCNCNSDKKKKEFH